MNNIEIKITPEERDIIIHHTFADPELTNRLNLSEVKGKHLVAKYSMSDLEDLIGFIAAEANHTEDKKLEKKLDALFERLNRVLEKAIEK